MNLLNSLPKIEQTFTKLVSVLHFFIDTDSLPSLNDLQAALLGEEDDIRELMSLTSHLLKFSLEDPGLPNIKEVSAIYCR